MRDYEVIFVIHPELDETAVNDIVEKVKGWVTDAGGAITKVDLWGKRKLAYTIRKQREGQYVMIRTQMLPAFGAELERNLRFTEPIMRFLVTSV